MVCISVELQQLIKAWVWDGDSPRPLPLGTRLEFQLRNGWPMDSLKVLEVMDRYWILRGPQLDWWVKLNIRVEWVCEALQLVWMDLEEKLIAHGVPVAASLVTPPGLGGPDQQPSGSGWTSPSIGSEQSALQFGDWITVATPMIGDVAGSARGWWLEILREVAALYGRWLTSTPLERIRLQVQRSEAHLRLEQRVVPMLLKCTPEVIKQDLIASRAVTVTRIMYRLWTIFQPGRSSERWNRGDASSETVESLERRANYVDQGGGKWKGCVASDSSSFATAKPSLRSTCWGCNPMKEPIPSSCPFCGERPRSVTSCMVPQWTLSRPTKRRWSLKKVAREWFLAGDGSGRRRSSRSWPTWKRRRRHVRRCPKSLFWNLQPKLAGTSLEFWYDLRS